ncbi:hypothetical protein [Streptomyces sp. NPDC058548]|uniref:hypothetical protein n=1 Tax=unclassified Streptomyces TaxID=2593676 RepID=UPI00365B2E5D
MSGVVAVETERRVGPFRRADDPERVAASGRLLVERYLEKGLIVPGDIDARTGCLTEAYDPHVGHSDYFLVTDPTTSEPVATARLITLPAGADPSDRRLPMETDFELFNEVREQIAKVRSDDPRAVVEISALARKRGAGASLPELYRSIWQHAVRSGYLLLLMRVEPVFVQNAAAGFGEVFAQAGPEVERYRLGGATVPMVFEPTAFVRAVTERAVQAEHTEGEAAGRSFRQIADYFVAGLTEPDLARLAR